MATTLATIRNSIRQRADIVNSQFIIDSELNGYINASYYELYDLLVQKYGDNYYVANPSTFVTDGVNDQFALPADFYKLLGVDLQTGGSAADGWISLHPFTFAERNRYAVPNFQSFQGITNLRYRLNGGKLYFTPRPMAGQTVRVWYVPRLTALVADGDVVDGVSGWEEYIVIDCIIKCRLKGEEEAGGEMAMKVAMIQRIESAAANRDAGAPATVADVRGIGSDWPPGYQGG